MTTIHADEMQPGDIIVYNGHTHNITLVVRWTAGHGRLPLMAPDGPSRSTTVSWTSTGRRDDFAAGRILAAM